MTASFSRYPLIKVSISQQITRDGVVDSVEGEPDHISEDYMDRAKKILGDGNARVSVSMDIATKDFGNGNGTMVNVSVNCNQDEDSILKAFQLCKELSQEYAVDSFQEGQEIFDELKPEGGR